MALISVALDTARSYLNDAAGVTYTNAVLLPFAKEAHRELQGKLFSEGLPVLKTVAAVFTVPAATSDLTALGSYPTNLIEPQDLYEKAVADPITSFFEMSEVNQLPQFEAGLTLRYWIWEEEKIKVLAASVARSVKIVYTKGLDSNGLIASSSIGFIFGENYLGPRIAALQAKVLDNIALSDDLTSEASQKISEILAANVKGMQGIGVRRPPYNRPRRRVR